jgi:hypothetical protein
VRTTKQETSRKDVQKRKKRKAKKPAAPTPEVVNKPEVSFPCPWHEDEPLEKSKPDEEESEVSAVAEEGVPDNWDDE